MSAGALLAPGRIEDCLRPELMGPMLAELLRAQGEASGEVADLRVLNVRRSASKRRHPHPLTVVYELTVRGPQCPQGLRRRFYGKLCRPGAIDAKRLPARAWHLDALDLLLWPWPADPGLPQLEALLDPACVRPHWGVSADAVEVLRHEPEVRALLVYTRVGPEAPPPLYAKTFAQPRAAALARRFAHFADRARHDPGAPGVADTLGADASGHTLWQMQAPGEAFDPMQRVPTPSCVRALAAALAALHRAPQDLAGPQTRDPAHWLRELERRCEKLLRVVPEFAPQLGALKALLQDGAAHLVHAPRVPIHGDCHPGQYRWQGDRVLVFDLDEMCLGDPMEDLAEFLVGLDRDGDPLGWSQRLAQAYAQGEPGLHDAMRLNWHRAMQHLLQAARSFVFQAPDWRHRIALQLQRALEAAAALRQV